MTRPARRGLLGKSSYRRATLWPLHSHASPTKALAPPSEAGKRLPTMQRRPPSACAGASQAFRQKVAPFVPLITLGRRRLRSRATCYEQSRLWCTAASGRRGMHGQPTRRSVRPRLRPCVGRWHRWCIAACVQPSTGGPRMRPSGPKSSAAFVWLRAPSKATDCARHGTAGRV